MATERGLKAVHVLPSIAASEGGLSLSVKELCEAVAAHGAEVELLSRPPTDPSAPAFVPDPNVVGCFPPAGRGTGSWQRLIRDHVRPDGRTVLHSHGLWLPVHHTAARFARASRTPLVISPHGMLTPWALRHRAWKKKLAWHLYQRNDLTAAGALHATSTQEADEFRALGLRNPVAVIPLGIALPPPAPPAERPAGPKTAVFLSRIHPKKGLLDFVAAWAEVRPPGWRVVIAGPDVVGHQADVEAAVHARGLGSSFAFPGPVHDGAKWELYRRADLFVLPSYSENFGLVVAEALACGVPVITTRATPWQDLVTHGCGWWIDTGAESLAAALRTATALSDGERRAMGERGRRLIEGHYSWPPQAAQMLAVYRWLLSGGTPPACVRLD